MQIWPLVWWSLVLWTDGGDWVRGDRTPTTNGTNHVLSFEDFEEYKIHHNKTYLRQFNEDRGRKAFLANMRLIADHNAAFLAGNHSFQLRPNHMADLSNDLYLRSFVRLRGSHHRKLMRPANQTVDAAPTRRAVRQATATPPAKPKKAAKKTPAKAPHAAHVTAPAPKATPPKASGRVAVDLDDVDDASLPERFDWREHGFVTGVENQKSCGACYAFSIAYAIEAQMFKRTGAVLGLSVQQLLDCSTSTGNHGCAGGSLRNTLRYVEKAGGLMRAQEYPYVSSQKECEFNQHLTVAKITSWAILKARDETAMKAAIVRIGPLAISINASPKTFQLYSHGVYDDDSCAASFVNHAMLCVGYTEDAWILKNWWGQRWGDGGYMYVRRGKNMCGLSNYVAYAVI